MNKRILTRVFAALRTIKFKRGQVVFRENDKAQAAYIVKQGECEVSKFVFDRK